MHILLVCNKWALKFDCIIISSFYEEIYDLTGLKNCFSAWEPSEQEVELLQQNRKRRRLTSNSTIGNHSQRSSNNIQLQYNTIQCPFFIIKTTEIGRFDNVHYSPTFGTSVQSWIWMSKTNKWFLRKFKSKLSIYHSWLTIMKHRPLTFIPRFLLHLLLMFVEWFIIILFNNNIIIILFISYMYNSLT